MNKATEMYNLSKSFERNYTITELMNEIYEKIHFAACHKGRQICLYLKQHSLLEKFIDFYSIKSINFYALEIEKELKENGFNTEYNDHYQWIKISWDFTKIENEHKKGGLSLI
jgi:hypothetical protein